MENENFINKLPDDILSIILSKLRVDEAVRCDMLSKRWVGLWKKTPHMEFHGKHMIMPFTQLLHSRGSHSEDQDDSLNKSIQEGVSRYGIKISQCLDRHSSDISSCHIMHFRKSLVNGDVNTWLDFLIHKRNGFLKDLSLECILDIIDGEKYLDTLFDGEDAILEGSILNGVLNLYTTSRSVPEICKPLARGIFYCLGSLELTNYTIDSSSAFEDCCNLKILKLKRIQLDQSTLTGILENCVVLENFSLLESNGFTNLIIMKSELKVLQLQGLFVSDLKITAENLDVLVFYSISCPSKYLSIYAPRLQKFQCDGFSLFSRILPIEKFVMEQHQIPVHCNDLLGPQPTSMATIFENMVTLCIDLDMKEVINNIGLYLILKSCLHLKSLQINNQVNDGSWVHIENDFLPYHGNIFWQRNEVSECMNHSLKSLCIKGYTGKGYEIEFVKCIITNARDIETITLWFVDDCSWDEAIATQILLSFPKASSKLFIKLKPGTEYMRKVGGSFQMWIRTLG